MKSSVFISKITLILALSFITTGTLPAQKKEKDKELDKKVLLIELSEEGKKKATPDELSFSNNKMKSKFFDEKGFKADAYTVSVDSTAEEKTVTFEATLKSSSEEELVWTGTWKGKDVEGTAVLSKKGKVKKEYTFSGTVKQKGKK